MLVLALDSSTRSGSIALARDGRLLESRVGDGAVRHAVRLPTDLLDLLAAHGCALGDVDVLAAAIGPGGFTGLRVGLATVAIAEDNAAEALRQYDAILALRPRFADAQLGRSWALMRLGRLDDAERALAEGYRLGANRSAVARQRALLAELRSSR